MSENKATPISSGAREIAWRAIESAKRGDQGARNWKPNAWTQFTSDFKLTLREANAVFDAYVTDPSLPKITGKQSEDKTYERTILYQFVTIIGNKKCFFKFKIIDPDPQYSAIQIVSAHRSYP
ncbi:hypothetical protein LBMAG48_24040 [Phycisphaerae bacterium]|nr:hypothetical protein LBMAG48_24040 [Phycisphaerae bacterium]